MTPAPLLGPRRRTSTGAPPNPLMENRMASILDVTLVSELREIQILLSGLSGILRPGSTPLPQSIALLTAASGKLSKLIPDVEIWVEEIRAAKFRARTDEIKAQLVIPKPPPIKKFRLPRLPASLRRRR